MLLSRLILITTLLTCSVASSQVLKDAFKFSTFYAAASGSNSIADQTVYSVANGLGSTLQETPYDYSLTIGVRKIARFGYENRANVFYDGSEESLSDAANVGKRNGLEFLSEIKYKRQMGQEFLDQDHFLRYVGDRYILKCQFLQDGFADVSYVEASERYRQKIGKKLSFNLGLAQRLAEPYGYNPLSDWILENGDIHYTYLAIQEGYTVDVTNGEFYNPSGELVATSHEVWEEVVIPNVILDYSKKKRNELNNIVQHSIVLGFDLYHYTKSFWLHSWGSVMPMHYDNGDDFLYNNFVGGQWVDYSAGLIVGYKVNRNLGFFVEGKYNRYWNREWYNFKCGLNCVIF